MQTTSKHIPKSVMIIDDDPFSVMLSKMKLKKLVDEDHVFEFYNTDKALGFLEAQIKKESAVIPEIILLEVMMNETKGWDFISQFDDLMIGSRNANVQLLILTSSQFFSDYRRASKFSSVKGFMMKPMQIDQMLDIYSDSLTGKAVTGSAIYNSFIA